MKHDGPVACFHTAYMRAILWQMALEVSQDYFRVRSETTIVEVIQEQFNKTWPIKASMI